jgi:hypothetical protein
MGNIAEIEAAIEKLPVPQVDELARWLEAFRQRRVATPQVENWLERARGVAQPGLKTDELMILTMI